MIDVRQHKMSEHRPFREALCDTEKGRFREYKRGEEIRKRKGVKTGNVNGRKCMRRESCGRREKLG